QEQTYSSDNYKRTLLRQNAKLEVENEIVGEINICYIKPVKLERKRIFLPEEQKLLNTIANKLSSFIAYQKMKEAVAEMQKESSDKAETIEDGLTGWLQKQYLSEEEIGEITRVSLRFKKGETICKQGSFATYIMLLNEGLVKAAIEDYREKSYNFKITKPYAFIGLSELFGTGYYHFSATALTNTSVCLIEKGLFKKIVAGNKPFAEIVMEWYCSSIEHLYDQLSTLAGKQTQGRIAQVLVYLSEEVFNSSFISSGISRKDIAEMAGMSTESAVRVLSDFKQDGLIKMVKSGIEVVDAKLLKKISLAG
ncbi:MAG: hypothetical protein C0594_17155, partial [Marinilabiliales bacterium]